MAAVSQKIPNLLGGVSQQPDPVKLPGQVKAADNVYLDPTFGCRKRPGSEFIAELGTGIPLDARWFSIFRDNNERYAVALYNDPGFSIRVWDLNDATERTVTVSASAAAYFDGATQDTVEQLTIADYTMMVNVNREVSMSSTESPSATAEALVTVDQISYNSNYNIDFSDAGATPTKVYSATGLEVIPGSYEVRDGGTCSDVDAQNFSETSGSKTGLQFRLVNQCSAYLSGGTYTEYKPKTLNLKVAPAVPIQDPSLPYVTYVDYGPFKAKWTRESRPNQGGGYTYKWVSEVYDSTWSRTNLQGNLYIGSDGSQAYVSNNYEQYNSDAEYVSRYRTDVILQNGGVGWRVNDIVTVTMQGKSFQVRVSSERFTYAYNNLGTATFTTPADTSSGVLTVANVVSGLVNSINTSITDFTAESVGNVIKIVRAGGGEYNIGVRGGTTNRSMTAIKGVARDIADLPTQCFDGYVVKVNNTDDERADDYYVKFTTESPGSSGSGAWTETVAPGIKTELNSSSMPHALIRQADGSFTLDPLNSSSAFEGWAPRQVGDEVTNPEPSFVGRAISNMFFYANRLGFLSEDAVILSQPGDYFNFFTSSALTTSDIDPIDLTASSTKPAILKAAIGTPKGIILFAERSQFLLATDEVVFSTATAKLKEISNYFYRSRVLPLNTGVSVAFISESNTYSKVLEMAVDSVANRPVVADITRIIPEYLPSDFAWGEVSPNNNFMVFGDDSNDVYTFKFFNNGEERQLAGWTKWSYAYDVQMWAFEDDLCYIVVSDNSKHYLLKSELVDDPDTAPLNVGFSAFTPRLDAIIQDSYFVLDKAPVVNDELTKKIYLPDVLIQSVNDQVVFMSTVGNFAGVFKRPALESDGTGYYIVVENNLVDQGEWVVGLEYTAKVTLPSIFVTLEGRADRVFNPMVEFIYLDLYYSGRYEAVLSKVGYDTSYTSLEVTVANSYDSNAPAVGELGEAEIPVFAPGDIIDLSIECPDPYPSAITGYSWQGHYNNRGIRPLN